MGNPAILVVGAGAGVSASVARLFAADGHHVGLLGIDEVLLVELATALRAAGHRVEHAVADVTDAAAATAAVAGLGEQLGRIDVLHFNPSAFRPKDALTLTSAELLEDVALGVGGLLTALQAARPYMRPGSRITATGSVAADRPPTRAASLGVQKAGLRNLVHSIDATLEPHGIRAVSVTVRGALSSEGAFTPDRVAAAIHDAARQPDQRWRTEVVYEG